MITSFCDRITDIFLRRNIIENEDREIYKYGLEISFSTFIGFAVVLGIGLITKCVVESLLFYLCFVTIRIFTGGYHAGTYFRCKVSFGFLLVIVLGLTNLFCILPISPLIMIPLHILGLITVYKLAPVENHNKLLEQKKIMSYKKVSMFSYCSWLIISFVIGICQVRVCWIINITICSIVCLIVIGKMLEERRKNDYETER